MEDVTQLLDLEPNAPGCLVAKPKRFERGYVVDTEPAKAAWIAIYREMQDGTKEHILDVKIWRTLSSLDP